MIKEGINRIAIKVLLSVVFLGTMLCTSVQASGDLLVDITYDAGETTACAQLYNYYTDARYSQVYILGGSNRNSATTLNIRSQVCSSGDMVGVSVEASTLHIWGHGDIYNAGTPYAGVAWSDEKQVR